MSSPKSQRGVNLFDLLRIFAAGLVIVGHAWPLSGFKGAPTFAGIPIHTLGVYVFFVISGYLLEKSWRNSPKPKAFLIRRMLRIFPALFAVVLLTVFVIGPLVTTTTNESYWGADRVWSYLSNLVLWGQFDLPGVFVGNPTTPVNGSLWSLGPEFCCYLMLVVLGLVGVRFSVISRLLLAVSIAAVTLLAPVQGPTRILLFAVAFFILGSLIADLPRREQLPVWPGIASLVLLGFTSSDIGLIGALVVLPYAVVVIGSIPSPIAGLLHRFGDPSYGMYLWGFPVQQLLTHFVGVQPVWVSAAVVLTTTVIIGLGSWHLIEKLAINLGNKLSAKN